MAWDHDVCGSLSDDGGVPGASGRRASAIRIDYVMLSPNLMAMVTFRQGVFSASHRWPMFDTMKKDPPSLRPRRNFGPTSTFNYWPLASLAKAILGIGDW